MRTVSARAEPAGRRFSPRPDEKREKGRGYGQSAWGGAFFGRSHSAPRTEHARLLTPPPSTGRLAPKLAATSRVAS